MWEEIVAIQEIYVSWFWKDQKILKNGWDEFEKKKKVWNRKKKLCVY